MLFFLGRSYNPPDQPADSAGEEQGRRVDGKNCISQAVPALGGLGEYAKQHRQHAENNCGEKSYCHAFDPEAKTAEGPVKGLQALPWRLSRQSKHRTFYYPPINGFIIRLYTACRPISYSLGSRLTYYPPIYRVPAVFRGRAILTPSGSKGRGPPAFAGGRLPFFQEPA